MEIAPAGPAVVKPDALEVKEAEPFNSVETTMEEDLTVIEEFDPEEFQEVGVDFINLGAEE